MLLASILGMLEGTHQIILIALAILLGLHAALTTPASAAILRTITSPDQFPRALSIEQTSSQLGLVIGRPLGGILLGIGGFVLSAAINTMTLIAMFSAVVLLRVDHPRTTSPVETTFIKSFNEGLRVVLRSPILLITIVMTGTVAGFLLPLVTLIIPVTSRMHRISPAFAGVEMGLVALGTLAVALWVSWKEAAHHLGLVASVGLLIAALGVFGFIFTNTWVLYVSSLAAGLGQGLYISHGAPLVRAGVKHEFVGRVQSILALVQAVAMAGVTLSLARVGAQLGMGASALIMCVALLTTAVVGLVSRHFRRATTLDLLEA